MTDGLKEAIEAVVDARFQFGCTPEILENRAKRVAQIAQQEVYDALRAELERLREDKARLEDALEEIRDSDDPRWYDHTTKALHPARASQQEGRDA